LSVPQLKYEELVIGSSLDAVLFAFSKNLPIIFSEQRKPFRFDYFGPHLYFKSLGIEATMALLENFTGGLTVGVKKLDIWERLLFVISLAGKLPLGDLCRNIRWNGESLICSNEYSKIAEIQFEHCYFFSDNGCPNLLQQNEVVNKTYLCYDWIAFNRGGKHNIDLIETDDEFVKQIWFYSSDRIDGKTEVKDGCAVSCLSEAQLNEFDYSETMARFKTIAEMENRGMKGKFNGYGPNGHPKYYKFRTTHLYREKILEHNPVWIETETITTPKTNEMELLLSMNESAQQGQYRKLIRTLME
jgi:hypothetical protein